MKPRSWKLVKWLAWVGTVLVFLGACLFVGNRAWYRARTWTPVNIPVPLTVGHISTPEFAVNVEDTFTIRLDVDPEVPARTMDAVLGIGDLTSGKTEGGPGFKLSWVMRSDGKDVLHGISDGRGEGFWGSRRGRVLGSFHAEKGKRYRLDVDVLEDGSQLEPYHPHLRVSVDLFTLDGYAMATGISEVAALAVVGFGTALLISAMIVRLLSRRYRP
jgi:hypothetical protein